MRGIEPAYTMLADQGALPEELLKRIYRRMPAGPSIKTTWAGRFDELDRLTAGEVEMRFPRGRPIRVHDIAVSSAITSVELFRCLSETRTVMMKASDYYDAVLRVHALGLDFLFDVDGEPLQVAVGKTALSMRRGPWRFLLAPLWPHARRRLAKAERISLFHPEALRLAATNPAFRLVREDYFDPAPERFDVVRLANALWDYRTSEQIRSVIEGVTGSVAEGGLLIVGRSEDYAIFTSKDGRFSEVARLGNSPDVAEVVRSIGN